jgi:hypothetical protein
VWPFTSQAFAYQPERSTSLVGVSSQAAGQVKSAL